MADGLYVFETTSASDSRLYAGGQWVNDKQQRCSSCGFFIHSSEQSEIEIALNHLGRHGFAEYLWNSHSLPIFREDLVELWQSQCLTGFQLKPVRIVGWYGSPSKPLPQVIPRYFWLTPTSQVCLIDPAPLGESLHDLWLSEVWFPAARKPSTERTRYRSPELGWCGFLRIAELCLPVLYSPCGRNHTWRRIQPTYSLCPRNRLSAMGGFQYSEMEDVQGVC